MSFLTSNQPTNLVAVCQYLTSSPVTGKLLKTAELTVDGSSKKLDTLLISTYREGSYALGVQGGRVLYIDAESLAVTRVLNVVSYNSVSLVPSDHPVLFVTPWFI